MRIGNYELRLRKRNALSGWQAALLSVLAILFALALFSLVFILGGVNPWLAYKEIFSYAFFNRFGLPLTIDRFTFLLLATCAFIVPFRAGLWNIGMTGQLYAGTLGAFAVVFAFSGTRSQADLPAGIVLPLMVVAAALAGSMLAGIAGFLKGKLDINEIVVTMMLNFATFWVVAFMIKEGGPFMNPGGEGEGFELPTAVYGPQLLGRPFTVFLALVAAVLLHFLITRSNLGYQIRAYGHSPAAARYAGISSLRIPLLVFLIGGALAGLAGYHYFAAVPGVYKIARSYGSLGDLAFYGIICGLISLGNPIAAIPVALLFGGLSIGGRFVQGKLDIGFGIDFALLGVLMIALVAFQFFYRSTLEWTRTGEKRADVGVIR
jgi:simple sugar transport system permease protein